jgi:hypothetical protein
VGLLKVSESASPMATTAQLVVASRRVRRLPQKLLSGSRLPAAHRIGAGGHPLHWKSGSALLANWVRAHPSFHFKGRGEGPRESRASQEGENDDHANRIFVVAGAEPEQPAQGDGPQDRRGTCSQHQD